MVVAAATAAVEAPSSKVHAGKARRMGESDGFRFIVLSAVALLTPEKEHECSFYIGLSNALRALPEGDLYENITVCAAAVILEYFAVYFDSPAPPFPPG